MVEPANTPPFPDFRVSGGLVFTSGQIALAADATPTPQGIRPVSADFGVQAEVCVDRLRDVLQQAGSGLDDVVRVECFLANASDLPAWHAVFLRRFTTPRPARTTLVASVPAPGFLIEVQAIATLRHRSNAEPGHP